MSVQIFDYGDEPFFNWMSNNPKGFVLNAESRSNTSETVLHRAGCLHLTGLAEPPNPDAYTTRGYIKVCAKHPDQLLEWSRKNRSSAREHARQCKSCLPPRPTAQQTPLALDLTRPPDRYFITTYRILRDTALAQKVKTWYENRCQLCGTTVELANGKTYAEAHHIQPLGEEGPDVEANIICVCPNHHAQLDYAAIQLAKDKLHLHSAHDVGENFIQYHNRKFQEQLR